MVLLAELCLINIRNREKAIEAMQRYFMSMAKANQDP
jgi:hypothetical protein